MVKLYDAKCSLEGSRKPLDRVHALLQNTVFYRSQHNMALHRRTCSGPYGKAGQNQSGLYVRVKQEEWRFIVFRKVLGDASRHAAAPIPSCCKGEYIEA